MIIGGGIAGGYTQGVVGVGAFRGALALAGVGGGILLGAIVPAVMAKRARTSADALTAGTVAIAPTGRIGRGTAGASVSLRF